MGRFISCDPAYQFAGFTPYGYALNNPLIYEDPDGRWLWLILGLVEAGANVYSNWGKITQGGSINWGSVGIYGLNGFVSGAIGSFGGGIGTVLFSGFALGALNAHYEGKSLDETFMQGATYAAYGVAFTAVAAPVINAVGKGVAWASKSIVAYRSSLKAATQVAEGSASNSFATDIAAQVVDDVALHTDDLVIAPTKVAPLPEGPKTFPSLTGDIPNVGVKDLAGKEGTNSVYQGVDRVTGEVKYVGITERPPGVRFNEHANAIGTGKESLRYEVVKGASGLNRIGARVWEQQLINQYGLENLYNIRNSIAPKNWNLYNIK